MSHAFEVFDINPGNCCYETKAISALAEKKRVFRRIT